MSRSSLSGHPRVRIAAAGLAVICVLAMSATLMTASETNQPQENAAKKVLEVMCSLQCYSNKLKSIFVSGGSRARTDTHSRRY
jgi:hypothetical protein